jgi:lipopolysaccharide/colanic/teichoic acid biosynthesis glycosyltransferase
VTREEIAFAIISGLLVNEATEISPWVADRLVRGAARRRYQHDPERAAIRAVEHARVIKDRPGKLFKLFTALGFAVRALVVVRTDRRPVGMTGWQAAAKRTVDVAFAAVLLALTLPLWAVIAVAIRLTSKGPVFSHELRVTKGGRVFRRYKFRTTAVGVTADAATTFKPDDDRRFTGVGRFLRRCGIDELPQLWNLLIGDMSMVGPRPLPPDLVAANVELLRPRLAVPAGFLGWWEDNRDPLLVLVEDTGLVLSDASLALTNDLLNIDDPLTRDLYYVELYIKNWSPLLDLVLLTNSFVEAFRRRGASEPAGHPPSP